MPGPLPFPVMLLRVTLIRAGPVPPLQRTDLRRNRGRKPSKGPRLPSPREAARKADRKRTETGDWLWQAVEVTIYGSQRTLLACNYQAVWARGLGLRPIRIVVVQAACGGTPVAEAAQAAEVTRP